MRYEFGLATPEDDAELRQVLARNPIPGPIALSYEREPNYFLANSTLGDTQVLVGREVDSRRVVALAARATRRLFINGAEAESGYLGQARLSGNPNPFVISRGFRFLKALHEAEPERGYITTIVEGNDAAASLLVNRPLKNVPRYRFVARLHTLAILAPPMLPERLPRELQVLAGSVEMLPRIVKFLREVGARKQFFPAYTMEDLASDLTRGFRIEDFRIVMRGGRIAGVAGLWNQSAFKQSRVRKYSGGLKYLRPLCNIAARISGLATLPAPGQKLRFSYASFVCVRGDDGEVLQVLVRSLLRLARSRGDAYLMLGLCEGDTLLPAAKRFLHVDYCSRLYSVAWDLDFHDRLDGRVPYVEIAAL